MDKLNMIVVTTQIICVPVLIATETNWKWGIISLGFMTFLRIVIEEGDNKWKL